MVMIGIVGHMCGRNEREREGERKRRSFVVLLGIRACGFADGGITRGIR